MDNATNAKRSAQLGMSHSTARSRLVKMLLFRELQRSGNDKCFKCRLPIEDIDHLSIEHIKPWLDVDPALYWDLDNIEYSHLACNRPHRFNGPGFGIKYPRVGDEVWCGDHRAYEHISKFSKSNSNGRGLQPFCMEATARRKREARAISSVR